MSVTTLLNSNEEVLNNNQFRSSWYLQLVNIVKAIRGALGLQLSGILSASSTPVDNSDSTATDLISYDFPKNVFTTNLSVIEIEAWGKYAANTNNKTVQLYFGSQAIFSTGSIAANNTYWSLKAKVVRTGDATQEIETDAIFNNTASCSAVAGTQNSNDQITIKCVGTGVSNSDITQRGLIIKLTPYT